MRFSKAYTTAVLLALCFSGPALADGFDTSGIAMNPELAARVPARIKEAGVLTIGSDTAYAPWEYIGEDGQTPEGIDVDIAKAIGRKLGVKIDFQTAAFDAIIPALGTKYDLGISAFSVTNERMKVVNFVNYFVSTSLWAVKAGNPTGFNPEDICGTNLAIQSGTWHEETVVKISAECVAAGKSAINILPFGLQTEALTRVAAGGRGCDGLRRQPDCAGGQAFGGAAGVSASLWRDGGKRAERHRDCKVGHGADPVDLRHDE